MSSELIWKKLCESVGLSENEAKVYVSLVERGVSEAREISLVCGVPRTKVYSVLKRLVNMGLVVEVPGDPKRFMPNSPKKAFSSYLEEYQSRARDFILLISSMEKAFRRVSKREKIRRIDSWFIRGRQAILRKIREILSKAETSVEIVTNEEGLILLYKTLDRLFDELEEKSVEIWVKSPFNSKSQFILRELRYVCNVEPLDTSMPFIFLCVDGNRFLLVNLDSDSSSSSGHDKALFSEDPTLCEFVRLLIYCGIVQSFKVKNSTRATMISKGYITQRVMLQ